MELTAQQREDQDMALLEEFRRTDPWSHFKWDPEAMFNGLCPGFESIGEQIVQDVTHASSAWFSMFTRISKHLETGQKFAVVMIASSRGFRAPEPCRYSFANPVPVTDEIANMLLAAAKP